MQNIETRSVDEQHTSENHQEGQKVQETATIPGVIAALGNLSPGAILYEQGLAELFDRHPTSIKRAVQRGEGGKGKGGQCINAQKVNTMPSVILAFWFCTTHSLIHIRFRTSCSLSFRYAKKTP